MTAKTATLVRVLTDWLADAGLYKLDPPWDGHQYVVVSSTVYGAGGIRTDVFPAKLGVDPIVEWETIAKGGYTLNDERSAE
jgi:hypothetical protein